MRLRAAVLSGVGVFVSASLALATLPSGTASPPAAGGDALFFDIPAQPLEAALDQYAQVTGDPAVFPSDLLGGRTSAPVRGRYPAELALQRLLEGTGLTAARRHSSAGVTFVLQPMKSAAAVPDASLAALFAADGYAGLAQMRIWQGLCADARTRPGNYSALLRFQLGADGRLHEPQLLGSSGDAKRDAALLERLRQVWIERAPPAGVARQALTLSVLPEAAGGSRCAAVTGQGK